MTELARYRSGAIWRELQHAIAEALLLGATASYMTADSFGRSGALAAGLILFAGWLGWRLWHVRRRTAAPQLIRHLNRVLPELEDSAQLIGQTGGSLLTRLQRGRVESTLRTISDDRAKHALPPRPIFRTLLIVLGCALVLLATLKGPRPTVENQSQFATITINQIEVAIEPPAYTLEAQKTLDRLAFGVLEGSQVSWKIEFSSAVVDGRLTTDQDGVASILSEDGKTLVATWTAHSDLIYRVQWTDAHGNQDTDFQLVELERDLPPQILVHKPEESPVLIAEEGVPLSNFQIDVVDDFAVETVQILATVAKGEGEGVKFRDEVFEFDDRHDDGDINSFFREWNLADLGMEPGDELYFRAVAWDSRQPEPNRSQTPVLMLRWLRDEPEQELAIDGIAVDLIPEYFRSQRQIIIDTEALIAEADGLSAKEGSQRSRDLAFDQKSLRLRYGQYLGEEFSSDISIVPPAADVPDGHEHESFAEHQEHAHAESSAQDQSITQTMMAGALPDFMADLVHMHDSAEQATLFDEKTRDTLKAALNAMWKAELELHLSRPSAALPHEYEALDYLKQVQQANRIYVRRAGFEPPPLDEGKRHSGELDDVNRQNAVQAPPRDLEEGTLTRAHQQLSSGLLPENPSLLPDLLRPEDRANALLDIARLRDDANCEDCVTRLQSAIWSALAEPTPRPSRRQFRSYGRFHAVREQEKGRP